MHTSAHFINKCYFLPLKAKFSVANGNICKVDLSPNDKNEFTWHIVSDSPAPRLEEQIASWVSDYCKKQEPKTVLPVVLEDFPPFTLKTLKNLQKIPFGEVISYRELAERTGNKRASRAVGNACGRNPCALIIPCHRVLASGGRIGGFSCGIDIKRILLAFEK